MTDPRPGASSDPAASDYGLRGLRVEVNLDGVLDPGTAEAAGVASPRTEGSQRDLRSQQGSRTLPHKKHRADIPWRLRPHCFLLAALTNALLQVVTAG